VKETIECPYCHGDNTGKYAQHAQYTDKDDAKGDFIVICKHCRNPFRVKFRKQFKVKFTQIVKFESEKLKEALS
jgi:hypothetical protein